MKRIFAVLLSISTIFIGLNASAQAAWTLNDAERRAFLEYYAPVVFKRGNGNKGDHGRDWITNFDFDRDFQFKDNKREWRNIGRYIDAARNGPNSFYERWRIRPTIYTALVEYTDGGRKNLVLFYHIYHGMDENAANDDQLHDWERIEIHINNVSTARRPGAGESIAFAVTTQHKRSVMRRPSSPDFNLVETPTGKHLMIWQAEWSGKLTGPHGQELRFIEDSAARIFYEMSRNKDAEVEIIANGNDKNVHYIFVPGASSSAVAQFNARVLNYQSAYSLTSFDDNGKDIPWSRVKRIQYELQDIADIVPTHWAGGPFQQHWTAADSERIRVVTPFQNREGSTINGLQTFYTKSLDVENVDGRSGYPSKSWFWGVYEIRDACDVSFGGIISGSTCTSSAKKFGDNSFASTARDDRGKTRVQASGDYSGARSHWRQHDYFVHSGVQDDRSGVERGFWLPLNWQLASRGGFDGRWKSLFPNNDNDPVTPFTPRVDYPSNSCNIFGTYRGTATGGKAPYTFTWKIGNYVVKTNSNTSSSSHALESGLTHTLTISDSGGQSRNYTLRFTPSCNGPGGPIIPDHF